MAEVSSPLKYRIYTCKQKTMEWRNDDELDNRKRAVTAAGDYSRRSKQMILIGTLRRLITSSRLEMVEAQKLTSSAKERTMGGITAFSPNKARVGHQTRGYRQSTAIPNCFGDEEMTSGHGSTLPLYSRPTGFPDVVTRKNYFGLEKMITSQQQQPAADRTAITKQKKATTNDSDTNDSQEKTKQPRNYSQQLKILKGQKMKILQLTRENATALPENGAILEVEGSRLNDESRTSTATSSSLIASSHPEAYQDVLSYTKYRFSKSSSAPKKLTHTRQRPDIVIPCHTNIECTYCQLYDIPHEDHDRATPKNSNIKETDNSKTKSLYRIDLAHKISKKVITLPTPANDSSRIKKKIALSGMRDTNEKSASSSSEHNMEHAAQTPKIVQKNEKLIEQSRREMMSRTGDGDITQRMSKNAMNDSSDILPKIYKFRYTKSSITSKDDYLTMNI